MSHLLRVLGLAEGPDQAKTPGPLADFWYGDPHLDALSAAGVRVTPDLALRVSAVLACVRVIAEGVAQLPLVLYERTERGGRPWKEPATGEGLYGVLHDRPNFYQTDFEFREMQTAFLALRGNAYAHRVPGPRGATDQLIPWHPDRVAPKRLDGGRIVYDVIMPNGRTQRFLQDEVMHLRWWTQDGLRGMSPLALAADSIGVSLATQRFAGAFFRNSMRPSGVMEHPKSLTPEARGNIERSLSEIYGGYANAMKIAVLEEGMKWNTTTVTPEEGQFLETRNFQAVDIARIFRVPPHMIAVLDRATNNNIEHQGLEFVGYTLMPWLIRWEKTISRDLIADPARFFAKHKVQALLRGDAVARGNFYRTAIVTGWMTRNEARELEDMNPGPVDLDDYLVPLNMTEAEAVGETRGGDRTGGTNAPNTSSPAEGLPVKRLVTAKQSVMDPAEPLLAEVVEQARARGDKAVIFYTGPGLEPLILDAAERLSAAEIRGIEPRAPKASANRGRFNAWLTDFYEKHRGCVERTLAPLVAASPGADGGAAAVASKIVADAQVVFRSYDPAAVLAAWNAARAGQIAGWIRECLFPSPCPEEPKP